MYNLIAIIFLIIGIFTINDVDIKFTIILFAVSIGYAIAGMIGAIANSIELLVERKEKDKKENSR